MQFKFLKTVENSQFLLHKTMFCFVLFCFLGDFNTKPTEKTQKVRRT